MSRFFVSDTNPNDDTGGAGTICGGEQKSEDCQGPYFIFPEVSTDSAISPHVVLCSHCLKELSESLPEPHEQPVIDLPASEVEEVDSTEDVPEV